MVIVTLMKQDDHENMVNQKEADQDVVDEESKAVDSRDEVMHSERIPEMR